LHIGTEVRFSPNTIHIHSFGTILGDGSEVNGKFGFEMQEAIFACFNSLYMNFLVCCLLLVNRIELEASTLQTDNEHNNVSNLSVDNHIIYSELVR
jgi:hypothetical protein